MGPEGAFSHSVTFTYKADKNGTSENTKHFSTSENVTYNAVVSKTPLSAWRRFL